MNVVLRKVFGGAEVVHDVVVQEELVADDNVILEVAVRHQKSHDASVLVHRVIVSKLGWLHHQAVELNDEGYVCVGDINQVNFNSCPFLLGNRLHF